MARVKKQLPPSYPRVSEILGPYTSIALQDAPIEYVERASKRGTALHQYSIAYAREDFVPVIEEDYLPYYNSFLQWYTENVEELILSESRLTNEKLFYCGQPDMIVRLKGEKFCTLIDIKSSAKIYKSYPVQLGAYMMLCEENGYDCMRGMILHLDKDGKMATPHDYKECHDYKKIFLQALDLYNFFIRKEDEVLNVE